MFNQSIFKIHNTQSFSLGFLTGIAYTSLSFLFINRTIANKRILLNTIIDFRRNKLLNKNKNIFYFDKDIDESILNEFKRFINDIEDETSTIDIILSTYGGSFSIAQMISDTLLKWKGDTNAIILDNAFSAGTFIALSCKNIYMHANAYLSPVDVIHETFFDSTQLSSISTVIANKSPDKIDDSTYILSDRAKKCKVVLDAYFKRISEIHKFTDVIRRTIYRNIFGGEEFVHDTTFSRENLIDMGLKINPMSKEQIKLSKLTKNY